MSKSDRIDDLVQKGSACHRLGEFDEAEEAYKKILKIEPNNFDALQLMGALLAQVKKYSEALKYLSKALKINPSDARIQFNQGIVLKELKRFDDALQSYDRAIQIEAGYADAYNNRGIVLKELKRFDDALQSYDRAIKIEPSYSQAYYNRGVILQELKHFDEALVNYDQAIAIKSNYINAINNRGVVLKELKHFDAALDNYNMLIDLFLYSEHDFKRLGHQYKIEEAKAYYNRGKTLQELKRFDEALGSYDTAALIHPRGYPEAWNNIGNIMQEIGRFDRALGNYNLAIRHNPDYADAYFNKSILLLLKGEYTEGWQLYQWRFLQEGKIDTVRSYQQPLWLGDELLTDKTLLIYIEQGFGDYIQFIRYALLLERSDVNVILEVPLALMGVIKTLKGNFILIESGKPLPDFDYHCPVMSLPLAFKTTVKSIPSNLLGKYGNNPYIFVDEDKKKFWNNKLGAKKIHMKRVGLVWSGNPEHKNDSNRSLLLKQLSTILTLPFEFHSLQKEIRQIDLQTIKDFSNIHQHQEEIADFSDTAALVDAMDIIISVDTSVAHLAGAMGKKIWILLPYFPDFRWMLDRDDSPWYPSVKLYRQEKINDWDSVLEKLKVELLKLVN
jgi:tetratricopeptide (TPR) repeat protein